MRRKPVTDPAAAEFMARMSGVPTHRICRALTRACTNAVNFYGCSKSHCANVWATRGRSHYDDARFDARCTLDDLYTDATGNLDDPAPWESRPYPTPTTKAA